MRIADACVLGLVLMSGVVWSAGCGRIGPRGLTDRLEGFWADDAGGPQAGPDTGETEREVVGTRAATHVPSRAAPQRRLADDAFARDDDTELDEITILDEELMPGSRRLLETATVFAAPDVEAAALGMVIAGTRLGVRTQTEGQGCATSWLEVAPRGYVCARTEASEAPPSDAMLPRVPRGGVVPGVYGKVASDAVIYPTREAAAQGVGGHAPGRKLTVHRLSRQTLGGRAFWFTREGFIPADKIVRHRGSGFSGVRLDVGDAPALPLAWVLARPGAERATVPVLAMPRAGARVVKRMKPRTIVAAGETERGFVAVDGGWIATADLRIARAAEPPAGVGEGERWVDVELGQQVLVAYEGSTPVYATMISSGRAGHRTPTGVFRVERKVAERTMNSMADSDEEYSVAKVPWTSYFAKGYALHAAYWHDGFGRPRSHGCVNLSPKDARELYDFLAPAAAPGWTEVYGHEAQPGTVVRVKSPRDPDPSPTGYMLAMLGQDNEST